MHMGYMMVLVAVLLMVWASVIGATQVTPHHRDVEYPPCFFNPLCSCSKAVPDLGIVTCRDVPLPRIPPPINSSKVFMLSLENNGMGYLEPHFLEGTGLYRLEVSRNPLQRVPDEALIGLERSLWELELSYGYLTSVPSRAFRHLQKLRVLNLRGNEISEINPESWRGLEESLQNLNLADNAISSLPGSVFSTLQNLDTLDLSGNAIMDFDPAVFAGGPPRLVRLNLADNQLRHIPYRQVGYLKALRHLDLSYNMISQLHSSGTSEPEHSSAALSLDTLRLDYNNIQYLPPGAFQHFNILNHTHLSGNPLALVQTDAFRDARIRELFMMDCGLQDISPSAFSGLEATLQLLDLSGNNLTTLPPHLLQEFDFLRTLYVQDNALFGLYPSGEHDSGFQYSLYRLDVGGRTNAPLALNQMRRMRNLRWLRMSRLSKASLSPDDFSEFGVDLEELHINDGGLQKISAHAFKHVRGLKRLDFSDNGISNIDYNAFDEVGHSLVYLRLSHALAGSLKQVPGDALRPLGSLQHLDLSHNKLQTLPETSFHFLRRLRVIQLEDNMIDNLHKGTFQGDIHQSLEEIYFSFNRLPSINTHTFVDMTHLNRLFLDDNVISRVDRRAFVNLEQLRALSLRGNKLSFISDEAFQNLPELEYLDLAYNQLRTFNFASLDQVGTLASFRLNMSYNSLRQLELNQTYTGRETVVHANVKVLDMSHNNITQIGRGFLRPVERSLTHLHMGHNWLSNATREVFGNMPHLQWLDLNHNNLYEIDFDAFRNTKKLQVLYMSWNHLHDVPTELFRGLSNLRVVDLSGNRLRSLPDSLFSDEGLERVSVSWNQLSRMPVTTFSSAAASTLCELDLSHNAIATLHAPETFSRFRSLMSLDLSYNRLLRLEDSTFASMPRLFALELSHNTELSLEPRGRSFIGLDDTLHYLGLRNTSLNAVPELPLPSLHSLQLSWNSISVLPPEMASNMSQLRDFDLSHNLLTQVPLVTHALPQLRALFLSHNPITTLTNTSLLGGAERLRELDIRHLPLTYFEGGALGKMRVLESLHISPTKNVREFNLPDLLHHNHGLRNLHIEMEDKSSLNEEMRGEFPFKIRNLTISGKTLRTLGNNILQGIRYPSLNFTLRNTSVESLPKTLWSNLPYVRNITLDLRNNSLKAVGNPNTGNFPRSPQRTFLQRLWLAGNNWACDCELGWVEVWQRKKRQFLCRQTDLWAVEGQQTRDWDCRGAEDDLRQTQCTNRGQQSLIEVLKADLECGWGAGSRTSNTLAVFAVSLLVSLFAIF